MQRKAAASPRGPARIIQRASEKIYITTYKKRRDFLEWFEPKHLRDACSYTSYDAMAEVGLEMVRQRLGQRNTIIFMSSYQKGLFKEQKHTYIGPSKYGDVYESTTSFAAVDALSNGEVEVYSQAKFKYAGEEDEDGVLWINHLFGLTSGTLVLTKSPPKSQHIKF